MFGWFRRRASSSGTGTAAETLLKLPDDRFAAISKEVFDREISATHAMAVVAYQNIFPALGALRTIMEEQGQRFSFDEAMSAVLSGLEEKHDPINERRFLWFFLGFVVRRLTDKAAKEPTLRPIAADIWYLLAVSGTHLKVLLEHNIVWTDTEKLWFSDLKNDADGIRYVTNYIMPKIYRNDPRIQALGQKYKFWISTH
jgi:hypothetical protein